MAEGIQFVPGIYRTRDAGAMWEDVAGGPRDLMTRYLCLGISPAGPEVL